MPDHEPSNLIQLMFFETLVLCERNGVEPELGDLAIAFDMDVRGLTFIGAEENKVEWSILKTVGIEAIRYASV